MSFAYAFLLSFFVSFVSPADIPYAELESSFYTGNASAIAAYGKDKMLIAVLDKESVYSQSQATLVLKDFFNKKPATSFKFNFKGKETPEGTFAIGNYTTKQQENYRITIYFKKAGTDYRIERLTIERS